MRMRVWYQRVEQYLLLTILLLLSVIIPPLTDSKLYDENQSLNNGDTIWEEIEHDYIRDNTEAMDIVFRNATHGWVLSQNKTSFGDGIILHTTDSALSWKLQYHNKTNFLNKILLFTNNIWVTGRGGLLHSIDDGKSWEYVSIDDEVGYFYGIFFLNETLGWAGSERGLYKTVDGGATWNKTLLYPYEGRARDIYFTTPMNGWIIHSYGIYHTTDGGDSWELQHDRGGWSFSFVSDTEAWAVGDNMLAHMTDGEVWAEQPLPPSRYGNPPYMNDIFFMNKTHGWIGALTPQIAHTKNGGIDWYSQSVSGDKSIITLYLFNESLGWAAGWDGRIYRTTRANEPETYSWGSTNTTLLTSVSILIIAIVIISIVLVRFRKRPSVTPSAPAIE